MFRPYRDIIGPYYKNLFYGLIGPKHVALYVLLMVIIDVLDENINTSFKDESYFKFPPRCIWDLRSSGTLRGVYSVIDDSGPLKMEPIGCLETSVNNYQSTLRNSQKERRSHLQDTESKNTWATIWKTPDGPQFIPFE
jgi:hypothetical protein